VPDPTDNQAHPATTGAAAEDDADITSPDSPWVPYVCEPCGGDLATWLTLAGDKFCDACKRSVANARHFKPYRLQLVAVGGPLHGRECAALPNETIYACAVGRCWAPRTCTTTGAYRWQFIPHKAGGKPVLAYTELSRRAAEALAAEWVLN